MRADRLVSILMLLQGRGRVTAQDLAEELEVSQRTIYRDIDALCAAGVPIYADRGRGGGYALLDSYRTDLTGLTRDEVHALFMLGIPAPLAELGVSHKLKAALLKLSAALPAARREEEERVRQRVHVDSVGWFQGGETVPYLQTIYEAVWQDRQLYLQCRSPFQVEVEERVDPYGLVAKAGIWYLVCAENGRIRAHRVSRLSDVRVTETPFVRPADFDLVAFWQEWCADYEQNRPHYAVTARVAPEIVPALSRYFGERRYEVVAQAGPPDAEGWVTLVLPFETLDEARSRLLGYGRAVQVLQPKALRLSILDYATQIVTLYTT